ncbi:hypothetical protein Tco_0759446, partial [Tanacetum coccineum]
NPEGQQQSSSVSSGFVSNILNPSPDIGINFIFNLNTESASLVDVLVTAIAEPPLLSVTTTPPPPTPLITHRQQTSVPTPATVLSSSLQDLPNFGSLFRFDHRLKTLENNFSEFNQTNQFAAAVSLILSIVDAYLANKMHESIKTVVQLQSERLRDEAQAKNADFINKLDDNIKKIIKNQVKEQVKAQVSKILPKIEKTKNHYKALVDAYKSDKLILDTYGDIVSFKRRRDDEDKDEEPSAGSNHGSKRRRAGKEPELTSAPKEKATKASGKLTEGSKSHHKSNGESTQAKEPINTAKDFKELAHQEFETGVTEDQPDEETSRHPDWFYKPTRPPTSDSDWNKTLPDAHGPFQPWISSLAQMEGPHESFNELMDTPLDFSAFVMNRLKVDTLTLELLTGPIFELMKGSCKSLITGTSNGLKIWESARDVYSKRRIIVVTKLEIVEWQNYKHLDWITIHRDNDKLYKFKEGDLKRLRIQDIEDVLLLLAQGKRVEDLQLGVESYQKKLNITKSDTYRSDLKRRDAYTAYSNPRGFIYQNKDKKNKLMHIDELHKFSDGTLDDVRTALNARLKGIRMKCLPQTIWRQSDRERAATMI